MIKTHTFNNEVSITWLPISGMLEIGGLQKPGSKPEIVTLGEFFDILGITKAHINRALEPALDEIFIKRHTLMLEFQEEIKPFTPTIRELADIWKLKSASVASYTLKVLEIAGLVVKSGHEYYAITEAHDG